MQKFPASKRNILLIVISGLGVVLDGCQSTAVSANASAPGTGLAQVPVVAPAGSVLRVRLKDTLNAERSRPGDRFGAVLDSPVFAESAGEGIEVLPKGTPVSGRMSATHDPQTRQEELTLTLDSFELNGHEGLIFTDSITRTSARPDAGAKPEEIDREIAESRLVLPADSVIGFTLTRSLEVTPGEKE